jgi:predicted site-specific integrase-resolvase
MCEYLGMKFAEWARASGVHPQPAYRWFRHGTMPDLAHRLQVLDAEAGQPVALLHHDHAHLRAAPSARGRRVVVVDPGETSVNLVRDMIDVLVSFCARLYGRRGARNRVLLALDCAKQAPEAARAGGEDD